MVDRRETHLRLELLGILLRYGMSDEASWRNGVCTARLERVASPVSVSLCLSPQPLTLMSDLSFPASERIFSIQASGMFSQVDTRFFSKPLDTIPRVGASWSPLDALLFVGDKPFPFEIPFDDM